MRVPRMLLFVGLPVLCVVAIASSHSPFAGTWKFNPAKSKMGASDTTTSDVMRIKSDGKTISLMDEEVDAQGVHKISVKNAQFDGKDYPVEGDPNSDVVAYELKGPREFTGTTKKDGKVTAKYTIVVSEDGQTTTVQYTVYSEGRKTEGGTSVYDKQP
jgi:hypothetical protein